MSNGVRLMLDQVSHAWSSLTVLDGVTLFTFRRVQCVGGRGGVREDLDGVFDDVAVVLGAECCGDARLAVRVVRRRTAREGYRCVDVSRLDQQPGVVGRLGRSWGGRP